MSAIVPSKLKVDELRTELEKRGLDSKGLKAELVKRLTDALGSSAPAPAAVESEETAEEPKGKAKRKAPAKAAKAAEPEEEEEEDEKPAPKAKAAEPAAKKAKTGSAKVDSNVPGAGSYSVYSADGVIYDCMLNQTNIGQNNNKYYVIQVLANKSGSGFATWNRWGRVGEVRANQTKLSTFGSAALAVKDFEKKFRKKTANDWKNKDNFAPKAGKYTLLDMSYSDDEDEAPKPVTTSDGKKAVVKPLSLPPSVAKLMKLITDHDMFKETLVSYDIDIKKMPLGKISKAQLQKGFDALEELETELKGKARSSEINVLTSKFYTLIPHDFGRRVPTPINTLEGLQQKYDLLEMLGDMEVAAKLIGEDSKGDVIDHPLDAHYKKVSNTIEPVPKGSDEYKWIEKYTVNTAGDYRKLEILDVFRIDRAGEKQRFTKFKDVGNRKLLWHGTKVAVMVAILKGGLRIMPHSGGRVGRGIYFASENAKSAGYVGMAQEDGKQVGFMFLNEVVLGKEHHITRDDPSLRAAPPGHHSVIAKGRVEPDPKQDITIEGDFGTIVVPQGKAINMPEYSNSSFFNTEYLVYDEAQVYQRYLLKIRFN